MRKGENISKGKRLDLRKCTHRVIIPIHIPEQAGYYKESYDVFEMCLFSLKKTVTSPVKISVVSNGSDEGVNEKLLKKYKLGYIDELIIEKESIGKINSILKVLRTVEEPLVTITDADVFFLNKWEEAVIEVFESFPNAGMVSTVPIFRNHFKMTAYIWFKYFFSEKLMFRTVKNPEGLTRFAKSIGWEWLDDKYKDVIATLKSDTGVMSVVGATHMSATYKLEVFKNLPSQNSVFKLGGNSDYLYLDLPVIKSNAYRLTTYDNYAFHMGNTLDSFIVSKFQQLDEEPKKNNDLKSVNFSFKINKLSYFLDKLLIWILTYKKVHRFILRRKGLSRNQIKNFIE